MKTQCNPKKGNHMKRHLPFLLLLLLLCLPACGDDNGESIDGDMDGNEESESETIVLPTLSTNCTDCHSQSSLSQIVDTAGLGARDWMAQAGNGLEWEQPVMPAPGVHLGITWPQRGYHSEAELSDCSGCHPVDELGLGHSVKTFRDAARQAAFTGGANCAASCHNWLPDSATVSGMEPSQGDAPSFTGSLKPYDLLSDHETGHSTFFNNGFRSELASLNLSALNPGCGGCHQISSEYHGDILTCTYCHLFGSISDELHGVHLDVIEQRRGTLDPESDGMPSCSYCHYEDDAYAARSKLACYNCHLSGHQPVDAAGNAHFWPEVESTSDGDGEL